MQVQDLSMPDSEDTQYQYFEARHYPASLNNQDCNEVACDVLFLPILRHPGDQMDRLGQSE